MVLPFSYQMKQVILEFVKQVFVFPSLSERASCLHRPQYFLQDRYPFQMPKWDFFGEAKTSPKKIHVRL